MKTALLIFPHQLFEQSPLLDIEGDIFLIEEHLFFNQYPFHKQKIAFHRASMKCYAKFLQQNGNPVTYIDAPDNLSDVRHLIPWLRQSGYESIRIIDPVDYLLMRRVRRMVQKEEMGIEVLDSPLFLNTKDDLSTFFKPTKKKFFQTSFYIEQRKSRNILIDVDGEPVGGKWSFDAENRKRYPKNQTPPVISRPSKNEFTEEAIRYTETSFADNYGSLDEFPLYPTDFQSAGEWLSTFLEERFDEFGPYEDALVANEDILNHSVLTPMLNVGLLTPEEVIETTLQYVKNNEVRLNSVEGFVRQIIGWREFIRGIYEVKGVEERTRNFWGFERKIPKSFYDGTTGIPPIDMTIKKILISGYAHHIERLMVLGNFMVLCEFDPDEVYRWFMEMFIDAYDWVMVPNVYGMSQFADGGLMSTKPYISGSNYLMKMSDYKKGEWQATWDGLFWRFMDVHRDFFSSNPRMRMLVSTFDRMNHDKQRLHHLYAERFLETLGS